MSEEFNLFVVASTFFKVVLTRRIVVEISNDFKLELNSVKSEEIVFKFDTITGTSFANSWSNSLAELSRLPVVLSI